MKPLSLLLLLCVAAVLVQGSERRYIRNTDASASALLEAAAALGSSTCTVQGQQWSCPFPNAVCCHESAKACCPDGYACEQNGAATQCRKSRPTTQNQPGSQSTISLYPTITIDEKASAAPPAAPPAAASSAAMPSMASAAPQEASAPMSSAESSAMATPPPAPVSEMSSMQPNLESSHRELPKFRQNIIIVKNINVLTKGQQVPSAAPRSESSEESSEGSEDSEESSEASRAAPPPPGSQSRTN